MASTLQFAIKYRSYDVRISLWSNLVILTVQDKELRSDLALMRGILSGEANLLIFKARKKF